LKLLYNDLMKGQSTIDLAWAEHIKKNAQLRLAWPSI